MPDFRIFVKAPAFAFGWSLVEWDFGFSREGRRYKMNKRFGIFRLFPGGFLHCTVPQCLQFWVGVRGDVGNSLHRMWSILAVLERKRASSDVVFEDLRMQGYNKLLWFFFFKLSDDSNTRVARLYLNVIFWLVGILPNGIQISVAQAFCKLSYCEWE